MVQKLILSLLLTSALQLQAETRSWKSADGERSIQGEFLSRDDKQLTIRRSNRKEVKIDLEMLHADDRSWLATHHPLPGQEVPDKSAVFDQLAFGDSRDEVLTKLHASKFVKATVDDIFLGRTGLNGIFRTRQSIGGLDTSLYFDWTADNQLKEIILQTDSLAPGSKNSIIVPCWKELIGLLTTLHGKPIHENNKLDLTLIEDGNMSGTHVWKLDHVGSAVLGAAREGDKFQVVVRFTKEDIQPVIIPAEKNVAIQSP